MIVVNFFAGPGAGKSTTAAGLFFHLKSKGVNCELVQEYAKDMVWEGRDNILSDQLYLLAKQNRRLERLRGKVDFAITDSPLLMQQVYCKDDSLVELNKTLWDSYQTVNIFLDRGNRPYNPEGRLQTYEEAKQKDKEILDLLSRNGQVWWTMDTQTFDFTIIDHLIELNNEK